jgi:hypothetical protein
LLKFSPFANSCFLKVNCYFHEKSLSSFELLTSEKPLLPVSATRWQKIQNGNQPRFHLIFIKNFFRLPDLLKQKHLRTSWATFPSNFSFHPLLLKCLIKMPPFSIMLIISFSFNNAAIFCKNTCVRVLINQYST